MFKVLDLLILNFLANNLMVNEKEKFIILYFYP